MANPVWRHGMNIQESSSKPPGDVPPLAESSRIWWKIGILSFGGPAAQIALMHRVLVEEKSWLTERQFLNALNFCMLLPGPEAMQLATYAGWRLHGTRGGLIAGLAFVLPGAAVILALASVYALFGDVPLVSALFLGVKAAVLVIVIEALMKVSRRALNLPAHYVIAALAFVGIFFLELPYPLIVLAAALYGYYQARNSEAETVTTATPRTPFTATIRTVAGWLIIWWAPVLLLWLVAPESILVSIAVFFSKLAVVTFGGAYAVLAYMAQDVVDGFGWLTTAQMMDGLGLAETTPGPLILVTEFVGFIAAHGAGGMPLAVAGALVTLWVTFAPCFLWIFAGSPYIEHLSAQPGLRGALSAITAAVVGVILNLSVWFSLHVLFTGMNEVSAGPARLLVPDPVTLDWRVLVLALMSGYFMLARHWGVITVLALAACGGLLLSAF